MSTEAAIGRVDEALTALEIALDQLASLPLHPRGGGALERIARLRSVVGRGTSLVSVWAAEADRSGVARHSGTTVVDYLATHSHADPKEAAGIVRSGRELLDSPTLKDAATAGQVTPRQVQGIRKALKELPPEFTRDQRKAAEQTLLDAASTMTPTQLASQAKALTERLAPAIAADKERQLREIAAQRHRAVQNRFLHFLSPDDGSIRFEGSLPVLEAEQLKRAVTRLRKSDESVRRNNPAAEKDVRSRSQQDADALVALANGAADGSHLPGLSGSKPRVVVTMTLDGLLDRASQAGLLPDGTPIDAQSLRQLCCDASLIPMVLNATGIPLDVGRESRLVTPELRLALTMRDRHCAFPNCTMPDDDCEAHHVTPWQSGGSSSLDNLVLLCRHHHAVVEPRGPNGRPTRFQWMLRMERGRPRFYEPGKHPPGDPPIKADGLVA